MTESTKRIVVLISGRGSNMAALLSAMPEKHYSIELVVSDQQAPGLLLAQQYGIATKSHLRSDSFSREMQREALFSSVREVAPELIVLAGFMMIIPKRYTDEFAGKLVNIHPSLLPKYPGLNSHQQALSSGDKEHGCTVHFVDDGMDTGPIIAQARCPILPEDSVESLAARLLPIEHQLYPWCIDQICSGNIKLNGKQVSYSASARAQAESLGFLPAPN